ncbi:MAG TPA: retropepsin-like aspartic protease, partial [Candidatus Baltobacteraceae bacterium]|nr:retropepsin-like aspartic protease [Candidatus Baltobacteraceae bacterium]
MSSRVFAISAALFCVTAFTSPARADDGAALLLKHRSFAGWDASNASMSSWHAKGARTHGGSTDTFEQYRRGVVFRDRLATPSQVSDEIGFTGGYVWHADENAFWQVVHGRAAQAAVEWSLVQAEALAGLPAQVAGQADVAGTRCEIVRLQPKGLVAMDVYEDPKTGAFLRVVVAPGAVGETVFDDIQYTAGPAGGKVISSWTTPQGRYRISNFEQGAATSDLVAPPSAALWKYSNAAAPLVISALDLNERQVWVHASVNGHEGTFLLDTNAPSIILFDPYASDAGLENLGPSDFSPYVGNPQFEGYARARTLQVGQAVLNNVVVEKIDAPSSKLAGVLGYDAFAHAAVHVDLVKQTLQIEDPRTYASAQPAGSYTFPIDLTDRVPAITMTLPGGAIAYPVLDSDLSGFMLLSQALYDSGKVGGH